LSSKIKARRFRVRLIEREWLLMMAAMGGIFKATSLVHRTITLPTWALERPSGRFSILPVAYDGRTECLKRLGNHG
jgi:hypothetical protein